VCADKAPREGGRKLLKKKKIRCDGNLEIQSCCVQLHGRIGMLFHVKAGIPAFQLRVTKHAYICFTTSTLSRAVHSDTTARRRFHPDMPCSRKRKYALNFMLRETALARHAAARTKKVLDTIQAVCGGRQLSMPFARQIFKCRSRFGVFGGSFRACSAVSY
jgi:hypothetical protein